MSEDKFAAIERRIEWFLSGWGAAAAAVAALGWGLRAGLGAAIGASLCWLNFRWLRHGVMAVMQLGLAQANAEVVRVPRSVHIKFWGRFALLLIAVYAILIWLRLPVIPVLCGLIAVIPAVLAELVYELANGFHRTDAP